MTAEVDAPSLGLPGHALDGGRMVFRLVPTVEPGVLHALLRARLDDAKVGLAAPLRGAERLRSVVGLEQLADYRQARIPPAAITAHPHWTVGLGERAEGVRPTSTVLPSVPAPSSCRPEVPVSCSM